MSIVFEKNQRSQFLCRILTCNKIENNQRIAQKLTILCPFFYENCMTLIFEITRT
jgi:hypothetical protein